MKKIKILRIINRFNIGGPTYNATFLTAFLGDDYETMLVGGLPEEGESDSLFILEKYGVTPVLMNELVREPNLKSDRAAYKRLKEIIREFKPDIVHTHASKAGALGRKAASACKVPVIIHTFHGHVFHSYFGNLKTTLFKMIERNLAKKSTGIVAISEIQKKELTEVHKICPADKVKVVQLGFDLLPFHEKRQTERGAVRKKYGLNESDIAIAIVGRIAAIKDHSFFLDVIENLLNRTTKSIKVFIVGDGPDRRNIQGRVDEINRTFHNVIVMTSWIKDIGTFNAGMDIICLTSKNEGTPVSLIEAQAANIPIVTTDVGGVRDIVDVDQTGFVIPQGDLELYTEKLTELCEDEKIREKMSQNGWNYVHEKFHYTTLVQNMDRYYRELLKLT
ncbi:MAG: glycosyltransferase [Crocinitomicaceae bacterium]|nr:glycosyltransferase [Flavobacteriales bacterium]NQZ37416.1 glycosyltransferase [Crocinitomicaceae bacterium]